MTTENDPPVTDQTNVNTTDHAGSGDETVFDDTAAMDAMPLAEKKSSPIVKFGSIAVLVLVLGGGGAYYMLQQNQSPVPVAPNTVTQQEAENQNPVDQELGIQDGLENASTDTLSSEDPIAFLDDFPPQPELDNTDGLTPPLEEDSLDTLESAALDIDTSNPDISDLGFIEPVPDTQDTIPEDIFATPEIPAIDVDPAPESEIPAADLDIFSDKQLGLSEGEGEQAEAFPIPNNELQNEGLEDVLTPAVPVEVSDGLVNTTGTDLPKPDALASEIAKQQQSNDSSGVTALGDTASIDPIDPDEELQKQLIESLLTPAENETLPQDTITQQEPDPTAQNFSSQSERAVADPNVAAESLKQIETQAIIRPQPERFYILRQNSTPEGRDTKLAAAKRALRNGHNSRALGFFDELLENNANDVSILLGRGVALQRLQRYEEALSVYERVLQDYPENLEALTNVLGILSLQSPEYSFSRLERLHTRYPANVGVLVQMALARADTNDIQGAIQNLLLAQQIDPNSPSISYNLGVMHDRAGDHVQAVSFYRQALVHERHSKNKGTIPISSIEKRLSVFR